MDKWFDQWLIQQIAPEFDSGEIPIQQVDDVDSFKFNKPIHPEYKTDILHFRDTVLIPHFGIPIDGSLKHSVWAKVKECFQAFSEWKERNPDARLDSLDSPTIQALLNPDVLEEIEEIKSKGVDVNINNFIISEAANLILPFHREMDEIREDAAGKSKIGTTRRGIGPAYEDKVGRRSIRVMDLRSEKNLDQRLESVLVHHNAIRKGLGKKIFEKEQLKSDLLEIAPQILKFSQPVWLKIDEFKKHYPAIEEEEQESYDSITTFINSIDIKNQKINYKSAFQQLAENQETRKEIEDSQKSIRKSINDTVNKVGKTEAIKLFAKIKKKGGGTYGKKWAKEMVEKYT